MNPYDEYALEEAVRLKERFTGSVVTVFSVASSSAKEVLRKALALGADRAVLVNDSAPSDPSLTALLLSKALIVFYSGLLPDLIFCGKHSTDFQHAQVPPMLGELLGIASVSGITALNVSGELFHVEREIEGGIEQIDCQFPAVLSTEKGLNQPRKTSIKAIMEARKKPIEQLQVSTEETASVTVANIEPVYRNKICRFVEDETELVRLLTRERTLF
jgi:electron transfer flavoprotein beta subunit